MHETIWHTRTFNRYQLLSKQRRSHVFERQLLRTIVPARRKGTRWFVFNDMADRGYNTPLVSHTWASLAQNDSNPTLILGYKRQATRGPLGTGLGASKCTLWGTVLDQNIMVERLSPNGSFWQPLSNHHILRRTSIRFHLRPQKLFLSLVKVFLQIAEFSIERCLTLLLAICRLGEIAGYLRHRGTQQNDTSIYIHQGTCAASRERVAAQLSGLMRLTSEQSVR